MLDVEKLRRAVGMVDEAAQRSSLVEPRGSRSLVVVTRTGALLSPAAPALFDLLLERARGEEPASRRAR